MSAKGTTARKPVDYVPPDEAARMTFVQRHPFEVWDTTIEEGTAYRGRFSNHACAQARADWLRRFGAHALIVGPGMVQ